MLLLAGALANHADDEGTTPLFAASKHGHAICVQLLLRADSDVCQATHDQRTPLLASCYYGQPECTSLLLAAGARPEDADEDGGTLLTYLAVRVSK